MSECVVTLPTFEPMSPDRNPMFLESRVYQGSSGTVYPLPFIDRIDDRPRPRKWRAITIENEWIEVMLLPEIGGRIHAMRDKTNGYDVFYRQDVIKPALVGLTGPWASGGVEFNWPQHHRPATYLPVETDIEHHDDGSVTVWCSDHDPLQHMKGMHGICLHPGRSVLELKARVYNRTELTQTFLWWANAATRVHENYQSFFPPDVSCVADHARRSMSGYPLCEGNYYGVNYGERSHTGVPDCEAPRSYLPPASGGDTIVHYQPNDLSFYANIPVPTSYMCVGSEGDFFGGYDHATSAGVVHVANHHISPGKKQWTWGNHEFGYAWDRNLTEPDVSGKCAPYIEIMAGVYTDNQPDFSFLLPGETKTWSQYWYPIRSIGPASHATVDAAASLRIEGNSVYAGVSVSRTMNPARVRLEINGVPAFQKSPRLDPASPWLGQLTLPKGSALTDLCLIVEEKGFEILRYEPQKASAQEIPPSATEPPPPEEVASADELYLTGVHLAQYRHATRSPEPYWKEAIRRDSGDSRCHTALGVFLFKHGEFSLAEEHLRAAIARLTHRNANPPTGEAYFMLGLVLRHLSKEKEAYAAFYKAVWNQEWQSAGFHALAELDCRKHDWPTALDHLNRSLRLNTDNLRARNLRALVLRKLGRDTEGEKELHGSLSLDPLDWFTRYLLKEPLLCGTQTHIDIALDLARAGFNNLAIDLLRSAPIDPGTEPLSNYYLGWLAEISKDPKAARAARQRALKADPDYCFPARIEEIAILTSAMAANPEDARAPYYLGNLYYSLRRHREAIVCWEKAVKGEPDNAVAWRNLGIAYHNILLQPAKARAAYEKAFAANQDDARLLFERDQLWKRTGKTPAVRLRELLKHPNLLDRRDDLSVELCSLFNQTGKPEQALALLARRLFQPWEGGEGLALGQHVRTHLALGRIALSKRRVSEAVSLFKAALTAPPNLAESFHLLVNQSDIHFWLGEALSAAGDKHGARTHWGRAAESRGDFQHMGVVPFSEMTYFSALALQRLGRKAAATRLFKELLKHARKLADTPAKIDYFATSLPTMLLFNDDLEVRKNISARFLEAQALLGLGKKATARTLLRAILQEDPNHPNAADLLSTIS